MHTEYDKNLYYYPEKSGLEIVAQVDYSSGNYEFDYRVVWRNLETKMLLTARDEGRSCPTPFEEFFLESLEPVNLDELRREVMEQVTSIYELISMEKGQEFLRTVELAMK